jgi:hypothetical protein
MVGTLSNFATLLRHNATKKLPTPVIEHTYTNLGNIDYYIPKLYDKCIAPGYKAVQHVTVLNSIAN